ncbi:hypothetical protein NIES4102_44190 (plasmid) [Chondrocystis sp. NIES-4102]|nr:hypothetical protein NIES4102_44190 [Chondrocystis sp. NIES-4102]
MSQKKPSRLSTKPGVKPQLVNPDSWVESRNGNNDIANQSEPQGKTKRITFEVSEQQHQATKILAAQKGMTIKELMLSLLVTELIENQ